MLKIVPNLFPHGGTKMTSDPRLSAPIFNHLRGNLEKLSQEIHQMIQSFDIKESGILNEFDEIHHLFHEV